jgi:hypothetical protein
MPEFQNPHSRRLYDSLVNLAGRETAERITATYPLDKTPTNRQKQAWVQAVCSSLDREFGAEATGQTLMGCACGPAKRKMTALKKYYEEMGTLEAIAEKLSSQGAPSWVEGDTLFISYPKCYCSFVNKLSGPLPESWCFCGLGYTRRNLEYVFGQPVEVTLLESVKKGDKRCLMKARKCEELE